MSEIIRITVLVENSVHRRGLVAEHGLSFHVQCGERSLLFDTGQSKAAQSGRLKLKFQPAFPAHYRFWIGGP